MLHLAKLRGNTSVVHVLHVSVTGVLRNSSTDNTTQTTTQNVNPFCGVQDFVRIAQHLDRRTPGDCVQFYYRTQKLDEFAAVRRKLQLKKRRTMVRSGLPCCHSSLHMLVLWSQHLVWPLENCISGDWAHPSTWSTQLNDGGPRYLYLETLANF